jgi:hypothetical protein
MMVRIPPGRRGSAVDGWSDPGLRGLNDRTTNGIGSMCWPQDPSEHR